jgi:hypothetical protein
MNSWQTDNRHTDRRTDRQQTDIFELTPIHKGNFNFFKYFFFFCIWEGDEWGKIYTYLLATQVRFAHLLRLQGDKKTVYKLFLKNCLLLEHNVSSNCFFNYKFLSKSVKLSLWTSSEKNEEIFFIIKLTFF